MEPLKIVPGNLMSVSTGPKHVRRILLAYLELDADFYLLTECAKIDIWRVLRQTGLDATYDVVQEGELDSARSAVAIIYRRDRLALVGYKYIVGSEATSEGGGIRERPIIKGRFRDKIEKMPVKGSAGHAPPGRAPRALVAFMRVMLSVRSIRGGDFNTPARRLARATNAEVYSYPGDVVALTVPRKHHVVNVKQVPKHRLADADHNTVVVSVIMRRRKRRA